jgi:hypothetical protein
VVGTVRLALAGANLDIVGEACLHSSQLTLIHIIPPLTSVIVSGVAHPHGRVQGSSNLIILLQSGAAAQNLWQPELTDGALHVANLSLVWGGSLDPLRGFTANTAYHVGMSESLGGPLGGFDVES